MNARIEPALPEMRGRQQQRALEVIRSCLADPTNWTKHGGKRMTGLRRIISVPVGRRIRLLFVDCGESLCFIEAQTHEQYNRTFSKSKSRSVWVCMALYRADHLQPSHPAEAPD